MYRWLFLLLLLVPLHAELDAVKAEPNLEKRSALALLNADSQIDAAKKAYEAADRESFTRAIDEVIASVDLSYDSLEDTGKRARRSPKHFKRAELKVRGLIRRLDGIEREVALDDRAPISNALKRLHEVHDKLVVDIMTKK